MLIELHILSKGGGILRSHACIINIVCPVMYVHYLDHGLGSVVLSTTGGCRADKHSPTHQARHVTGKISAGAYGCEWAVLLATRDGAIPLSYELGTHSQGVPGLGMPCSAGTPHN